MDKFSVYEFLSFFLPGTFAVFIGVQFVPSCLLMFSPQSELVSGLMFTTISLIVGFIVHRISFSFNEKKWYKKLLMKPVKQIIEQNPESLKSVFDKLNELYNEEHYNAGQLFDKAYYYLEFTDRIGSVKTFQSIYFFLRNITLICILFAILMIIPFFMSYKTDLIYLFISVNLFSIPTLINVANFYRRKMTIRIFATYLIAMQYHSKVI
jgi:hypothetical protein